MENNLKKSGLISIIGRPNVGKSTLMNRIIGEKVAITSPKPQTTRNRIQTVYTCEKGQIVFLDTPGIHKAKNKLGEYMVKSALGSMAGVDAIMWLIEPKATIGPGEEEICEKLKKADVPVILVINKTDTVKKEVLLEVIDAYRKLMDFSEIVPVSAKTGDMVPELTDILLDLLPYGQYLYDEDTLTDQPMRQIVTEIIREKALLTLKDEVPHGLAVVIDKFDWENNKAVIQATIICEKNSHKGIIIGKGGATLKKIGTMARKEIEAFMDCRIFLELWVKVRKDWRESDILLKNYGFDQTKL